MKIKNVAILILLLIICGQFIQSFLLLKKFDRLKFTFEKRPVEVYVAGLTESIRKIDPLRSEIILQHHWLSKRLYKCIELLEQQKDLNPIPMEYPEQSLMSYRKSGLNMPQPYKTESVPFYEYYEGPNNPPLEDIEESDIRKLKSLINLQMVSLKMYLEPSKVRIENYQKRLKRIEEHWNK